MDSWANSRFDVFYLLRKRTADIDVRCSVTMEGDNLTVAYEDDGLVIWSGTEVSPGHLKVSAPEVDGYGTLHRMLDSNVLVGEWVEGGETGLWRIMLIE